MKYLPFNRHSSCMRVVALLAASMTVLAACGEKNESPGASQVAAKVGSSEISIHQINQALSRTPLNSSSKEAVQAVRSATLERLIDQQLAVDQATELKLHRSPDVVAKLEAARREVLARAYLERLGQGVSKPSADELKAYYDTNPALFSERRIFRLQELRMPQVGEALNDLRTWTEQGRNLDDVAAALKTKNVGFSASGGMRNAEQVPLDLLPKLHALKDGQNLLVVQGQGATLLRLVGSNSAPVTLAVATPGIEQFLSNRRTTETVAADIKRLRDITSISYVGDFVQASTSAITTATTANTATSVVGLEKATSPVTTPGDQSIGKPDAGQVERGLQGLK
jgi:EpsD family peptidyl-prolyl cis-trans isomerase